MELVIFFKIYNITKKTRFKKWKMAIFAVFPREREVDLSSFGDAIKYMKRVFPREREVDLSIYKAWEDKTVSESSLVRGKWI